MDKKKKDLIQNNEKHPKTGSYKMHLDSKIEDTATDIYYKTEKKIPDSQVSIPTHDAVIKAKDWVDDVNKM